MNFDLLGMLGMERAKRCAESVLVGCWVGGDGVFFGPVFEGEGGLGWEGVGSLFWDR